METIVQHEKKNKRTRAKDEVRKRYTYSQMKYELAVTSTLFFVHGLLTDCCLNNLKSEMSALSKEDRRVWSWPKYPYRMLDYCSLFLDSSFQTVGL